MTLRLYSSSIRATALVNAAIVLSLFLWSHPASAQQASQKVYQSADAAAQALVDALKTKQWDHLDDIVGFNVREAGSGDAATDRNDVEVFLKRYAQMHRFANGPDGKYYLIVGADNWSLPVPLAKSDKGWYFDGVYGKKETRYREIGRNELNAIKVCMLTASGEKSSGPQAGKPKSFGGYTYTSIDSGADSKSAAVIAYPTIYRQSGVMTFMTGPDGQVYEKDLGKDTASVASAIKEVTPDASWHKVKAG